MTEIKGNYATRFKEHPTEDLVRKPVAVALPQEIDEYVRSLPNRSEWLRSAIRVAYQKDVGTSSGS